MTTTHTLKGRRSLSLFVVVAVIASLFAFVAPATALDSAACPKASIPSAGFTDLAGVPAEGVDAINCIAFYGISTGTTATTFDPFSDVERWQMALFLTRAAVDMGVTLPSGADQGFTDLAGVPAAAQTAINQLKQLGISTGTTATTFDPFSDVERWQMALFLTRLLTSAGIALPSGADQGFTDLAGVPAAAQTAINQLKQLAITTGTTATTYNPFGNVERWEMALFLARTLQTAGVSPTGIGFFVVDFDTADVGATANSYRYVDPAACTRTRVFYASTDSFRVNGVAATVGAFEAALASAGNETVLLQTTGTAKTHILSTGVKVKSGAVSNTAPLEIWEPFTDNLLTTWSAAAPNEFSAPGQAFDFFTVDGAASTLAGFNANVSLGDQVVATGSDGSTTAKSRTFALTNATVTGTVDSTAVNVVTIATDCPFYSQDTTAPGADTFTYTVDGASATQAAFIAAATENDDVTYARSAGKSTWTLVNRAPAPVTGLAYTIDLVGNTVGIARSATSGPVVDWDTGGAGGGPVATFVISSFVGTEAGFEAALSLGDTITYQADNPATAADESRLTLVNGPFSGKPAAGEPDLGANTVQILLNGQTSDAVDYTALNPAGTGITGNTAVSYTHNGASATEAEFETAVGFASTFTGNVSVADSGTTTAWSATTP